MRAFGLEVSWPRPPACHLPASPCERQSCKARVSMQRGVRVRPADPAGHGASATNLVAPRLPHLGAPRDARERYREVRRPRRDLRGSPDAGAESEAVGRTDAGRTPWHSAPGDFAETPTPSYTPPRQRRVLRGHGVDYQRDRKSSGRSDFAQTLRRATLKSFLLLTHRLLCLMHCSVFGMTAIYCRLFTCDAVGLATTASVSAAHVPIL